MAKPSKTDCFQLKADFLPITTLRLLRHETDLLQSQLEHITLKAPHYFTNAPVIVDFTQFSDMSDQLDVKQICSLLRQYQMQPIAARGLKNHDVLPSISDTVKPEKPAQNSKAKVEQPPRSPTKIVTKPVRAGTQIYAKDADLIILSSVNAGAEVIADGNIHVYAPLRGRALAGASGDTNARIFCKHLEAELVSVAGHYMLNEKMKTDDLKQNLVQIYLVNDKLQIDII